MRMRAFSLGCLMSLAFAPALSAHTSLSASCATSSDVLGLERIVEIDATGGPEFGTTRGGGHDFLAEGEVVLTFDDGPVRTHTRAVLQALDHHCTKATFFMVGRMAAADPAMVQEVAARGHTIGAHTFSHARIPGLSASAAQDEIELGFSAVAKALDAPVAPFFRYPYLSSNAEADAYLRQRDIANFTIDIDSRDFRTRDGAALKRTVLAQLAARRKGILLFHDIQPSTASSLAELLADLKEHGYRVVHIVPRAPVTTLAAYDARAGRAVARRRQAVADEPLADRALTWSQSMSVEYGSEQLPWASGTTGTVTGPTGASTASNRESSVPWYRQWLFP